MRKRIFITGGSGLLGCNAARLLSDEWEVVACWLGHEVRIPGVRCVRADIRDKDRIQRLLENFGPDVILHTAALTDVEYCERNPGEAYELNAAAAENLAAWAGRHGVKMVHVSTDHFYPGGTPLHAENEKPRPVNVYARTKLMGEEAVLENLSDALVVRTNFYGWNAQPKVSFAEWVLEGLAAGRSLTLFSDVYFSPILVNDLVAFIAEAVKAGLSGVYNIAGSQRISKYDFAVLLGGVFGLPADNLVRSPVEDFGFSARRPRDMSLDVMRIERRLGREMPTAGDGLERFKRFRDMGYADTLKGYYTGAGKAA